MSDERGSSYEGVAPEGQNKTQASAEKRVALVVGNGAYQHTTTLKNPVNDARAMTGELQRLGFDVVSGDDLNYARMAERVRDFGRRAREATTTLIFYAGHGIQVGGRNYLVPIDAACEHESDVSLELIELQALISQTARADRTSLVFLDACRNNPLARNLARAMGVRSAEVNAGLAAPARAVGTFIAFATEPDHIAYDGDGDHGFFTEALVKRIDTPGLEVTSLIRQVRVEVMTRTQDKQHGPQVPWHQEALTGEFYFLPSAQSRAPIMPQPKLELAHRTEYWKTKEDGRELRRIFVWIDGAAGDLGLIEKVVYTLDPSFKEPVREITDRANGFRLKTNGWGEFEITAVAYFRDGRTPLALATDIRFAPLDVRAETKSSVNVSGNLFANPTATANQAPLRERSFEVRVGDGKSNRTVRLAPGESIKDAPFAPEMVLVPPGKFWMGATESGNWTNDQHPRHQVTIGYPVLIGKYPTTFEEWDAFVEDGGKSGGIYGIGAKYARYRGDDQGWGRGRRPVVNVSWYDVQKYVDWLSKATGKEYRLLSEAEWEYACRAGTETKYSFGETITTAEAQFSGYKIGSAGCTEEVGRFPGNAFGLHDMHGNVYEWCEDPWHSNYGDAPIDGSVWLRDGDRSCRVLRGGSWLSGLRDISSAERYRLPPSDDGRDHLDGMGRGLGFRLARTI